MEQQSVHPLTLEQIRTVLRTIWRELLAIESLDDTDSFMSLGGESILAMRCLNEISHSLSVEVSIDVLFDPSMSIERLAMIIALERQRSFDTSSLTL